MSASECAVVGFIQPDDGGPAIFVHISAVRRASLDHLADYGILPDRRSGKPAENVN